MNIQLKNFWTIVEKMSKIKSSVLITNASNMIGLSCTEIFLKNNYKVYCLISNSKQKNKLKSFQSQNLKILNFSHNKKSIKLLKKKIKHLDCIIYNFDNSLNKKTSFQKSKINQWKKSFEINFFQPIELVHVFYSVLKKSRSASVINISSLLSSFGGHPNMYQYGIAKLALDNFTKYVSKEMIENKIRMNSVLPDNSVKPEKISDIVYWLSSRDSSYVCGANIEINN